MGSSMWNLKNIDKEIKDSPNEVLREQAEFFEKETKDILYARIKPIKLPDVVVENIGYSLQTDLNIVCPALDNYQYLVCSIFSNPEKEYPILIANDYDKEELEFNFESGFECTNREEFLLKLSEILGSETTTNVVRSLYSKSKLF